MKRSIIFIAAIVFTVFSLNAQDTKVSTSRVTYVANGGFLVDVGDVTVMFDCLFQNGMDRYWAPTNSAISAIKKGLPPFDKVDLAFVSNKYANHFDPYLAVEFMVNNENTRLICSQQVINKMKIFTRKFAQIENRIIETTPISNKYDRFVINDVEIIACNVKYDNVEFDHIENMLYMVNVDGVKLLHTGDSRPSELHNIQGIDFSKMDIDLAFLSDKYAVGKNAKVTNELIDANYNVLMHFEKYVKNNQIEKFASRSKLNSTPKVFKARNEYQDFYLNDYIPEPFVVNSLALGN